MTLQAPPISQAPGQITSNRTSRMAQPQGVRCRDVVKRYGSTLAVDRFTFNVAPGTIQVLVGPSGCGKTTLLRCVAGLETVTEGTIEIGGHDRTHAEPWQRKVAMVFQDHGLYPSKTAAENIEFPLRMAKVPRSERAQRVKAIAELLRIPDLLGHKPAQLSGGQRQRVGIGRALIRNPAVLLMDEPLSSLDAQLRVDMRAELLELQHAVGTTIIYVTHDQAEALTLGDSIAVMQAGTIEQCDTPDTIYGHPRSTFVGRFIGAMNFLIGESDGHDIRLRTGEIVRPATMPGQGLVHLGVRPEHLRLGDTTGLWVRGQVRLVENLGDHRLCHVETGPDTVLAGTSLRVRSSDWPSTGELVTVGIPLDQAHLFDAGGRRMEPNPLAVAHVLA